MWSRGGSLAMILGTDVRLESPNPTPFIYQAKWKTWPIHILPTSKIDPIYILFLKIDPIHILFFKIYPFIYFLGEKDTPLIYFWCKNDTHSYTGRPEKYTPFQPHICIYLYNGSYPPVDVILLFNVTINNISVIYVTAHRCAGGLKKLDLRSGSQRHRHFVGFFNEPVQTPTTLFIRWFQHIAPFSRLLRHAGDTEDTFSTELAGPSWLG